MRLIFLGYNILEMSPCLRLARGLNRNNIHTKFVAKESSEKFVNLYKPNWVYRGFKQYLAYYIKKYILSLFYRNRHLLPWTFNLFAQNPLKQWILKDIDIIHLDWIANNFLSLKKLSKIAKPIVWTLHDTWPITGGCHCNLFCEKWITGCGKCPQLNSNKTNDISRFFWKQKKKNFQKIHNLTVVTPSKWLTQKATQSEFFKNAAIKNIPNAIDEKIFSPLDKDNCKKKLGVPDGKKILLSGAANFKHTGYKGFDLLLKSLQILAERNPNDYFLLLFGALVDNDTKIPIPFKSLGRINYEAELSVAYNAADVFIIPSRQDNFPSTLLEASSCGIPCVGFDIGGIPEIIEHKKNGFIAKHFEIEELANGVEWVLSDKERYDELSKYARRKTLQSYSMDVVAKQYIEIYRNALKNKKKQI